MSGQTMTRLMSRTAQFHADETAIIAGDRRLTFAEAWERGIRLANGLGDLGVNERDRVGVLEDNDLGAQDMFAAGAAGNFVRVPLYARDSVERQLYMLEHTGCRVLVVSEGHANEVVERAKKLPSIEAVLIRDDSYESWLREQSSTPPAVDAQPDDVFIIRHSGGTTGLPKGIPYTHWSWLAAGRDWFYIYPAVEREDTCLHVGPISHGSGYMYSPVWLAGGCNILVPKFDPIETLRIIEREKVNYIFMVPTMLNAIVHHEGMEQFDTSSLKVLMISGAPITEDTTLRARERFGDVLYQGYGQTEALPAVMMGPTDWFADLAGSEPLKASGRPLPFTDVRILDDDGYEVAIGEEGEIAVANDGALQEFWDDPQQTQARLRDGYVLTGDVGRFDVNGYLYVLDRKDDMIISGGFNIWPAELENAIATHPAIEEVAVFGAPHDRWGETPVAVCVLGGDASVDEQEIIDLVGDLLGPYKRPGRVEFRERPLPKSPVGKIQRKQLREPYWEGKARRVAGS